MLPKKVLSIFLVVVLVLLSHSIFAAGKKKVWPGIGMNNPGLFNMYLGNAFVAGPELQETIARKTIIDARNNSIGYFRFSASGFGSYELELWQRYPDFFWNRFDKMMGDLYENHVQAVFVLSWWNIQFPRFAGDSMHIFFTDPNSASRKLWSKYVREVVNRYKNHPAVRFWEMGNEWNLDADMDIDKRMGTKGDNYSTGELLDLVREFANLVRATDPNHLISNGFSMPRPAAEHIRRQPEWSPDGPDWTSDSREEFRKNLIDASRDVEIISVHFYNLCPDISDNCSTSRDNERFDIVGKNNVDLLDEVVKVANETSKFVFVGETGDGLNDNYSVGSFTQATLERVGRLKIMFSALWAWEEYSPIIKPGPSNIEPGFSDALINKIREVNSIYFNRVSPEPRVPDLEPPIVIITAPLEGTSILKFYYGLEIYALASDNDRIERVEFWLENAFLGEVRKAPYTIKLLGGTYPVVGRNLKLKAKAFDSSGNFSESVVNVSGFYFW
ncbi:MAG: cellulase family glycosylhydrolase [Candidatus Yanofskybacteria bacterium]|nr:cellulase family glycosylhydrolase [Candidatus Yanofskybacteria bacterium]